MVKKHFVYLFVGIIFIFVLIVVRYTGNIRVSSHNDNTAANQHYSTQRLVELAARSDNDQKIARRHLKMIVSRYGFDSPNSAVRTFDNSWQQRRLYILLSEIAPDKKWKETFFNNSKSPRATPVGDFGD